MIVLKMYYDRPIFNDSQMMNNREPDIVVLNKIDDKVVFLIDIVFPNISNLLDTYQKKQAKYADLSKEIKQIWYVNTVEVALVTDSATGLGNLSRTTFPSSDYKRTLISKYRRQFPYILV